jgi:hypothetical protein
MLKKKMKTVICELNVPSKIIATEENEKLLEDLRENILKMFTI